jgi:hypothetical protein
MIEASSACLKIQGKARFPRELSGEGAASGYKAAVAAVKPEQRIKA